MVNFLQNFMAVANQAGAVPVRDLVDALKKASNLVVKANLADIDKCVDICLSKRNSIAVLFLLVAKSRKGNAVTDIVKFVAQAKKAVSDLDDSQLEYVSTRYVQALHGVAITALERGEPLRAVHLLQQGIDKLCRGQKGNITDLHSALFMLCLAGSRFDPALDYLEVKAETVFTSAVSGGQLDPQLVLLYFYYGGLIHLALENFDKAAQFLQICTCLPAVAASAIMIESAKKLILVKLLLEKPVELPSFRSAAIHRAAQSKCTTYQALGKMYHDFCAGGSQAEHNFPALVEKKQEELKRDKNYGLVMKLYERHLEVRARSLPSVFAKVQLRRIPVCMNSDLELPRLLSVVEKLICEGQIRGKIDVRSDTVEFLPASGGVVDEARMEAAMRENVVLADLLSKCHREVNLHPVYLQRATKKGPPSAAAAGAGFVLEDEGVVAQSSAS